MKNFLASGLIALGLWFTANAVMTPALSQVSGPRICANAPGQTRPYYWCTTYGNCDGTCNVTKWDAYVCTSEDATQPMCIMHDVTVKVTWTYVPCISTGGNPCSCNDSATPQNGGSYDATRQTCK